MLTIPTNAILMKKLHYAFVLIIFLGVQLLPSKCSAQDLYTWITPLIIEDRVIFESHNEGVLLGYTKGVVGYNYYDLTGHFIFHSDSVNYVRILSPQLLNFEFKRNASKIRLNKFYNTKHKQWLDYGDIVQVDWPGSRDLDSFIRFYNKSVQDTSVVEYLNILDDSGTILLRRQRKFGNPKKIHSFIVYDDKIYTRDGKELIHSAYKSFKVLDSLKVAYTNDEIRATENEQDSMVLENDNRITWHIISEKGTPITKFECSDIKSTFDETYLVKSSSNHKWSWVNKTGKNLIDSSYIDIIPIDSFLRTVVHKEVESKYVRHRERYGLLNRNGKELLPAIYKEISFYDRYFWVKGGTKGANDYSLFDSKEELFYEDDFDHYYLVGNDMFIARKSKSNQREDEVYLYNPPKGYISENNYDQISNFSEEYFNIMIDSTTGFLSNDGVINKAPGLGYTPIKVLNDSTAIFVNCNYTTDSCEEINAKMGVRYYVVRRGEILDTVSYYKSPSKYSSEPSTTLLTSNDEIYVFKSGDKFGVKTVEGSILLNAEYEDIKIQCSVVSAKKDKIYTLYKYSNLELIQIFDEDDNIQSIGTFTNNIAPIRKDSLWGFIEVTDDH